MRISGVVVSLQAVYDVLRTLTDAGLVRRIQPAGSVARYEACVGDHHHHVVCQSCGTIGDVDCAVGYIPCLTAAGDSGYEIGEAEVTYWGRYPGVSRPLLPGLAGDRRHAVLGTSRAAQPWIQAAKVKSNQLSVRKQRDSEEDRRV